MNKKIVVILIFFFIIILTSEVIIKRDSSILKGKIIKMDEDTITVISSNNEMILDKEDISKIYYSEKEYEDELKDKAKIIEKPTLEENKNLISDGSFDEDKILKNWQLSSFSNTKSLNVENEELVLSVSSFWDNKKRENIDFSYDYLTIEKEKTYLIKFKARSIIPAVLNVSIEQSYKPHKKFHNTKFFRLKNEMKEYSYTFIMRDETEKQARLNLSLNSNNDKIYNNILYLDDVEITEIKK